MLPRETLARQGPTLDQLGALVAHHGLSGEAHHASDETLEAFRTKAREAPSTPNHYIVVNYLRKALGQQVGDHISPLSAYDEKQDRFSSSTRRGTNIPRFGAPPLTSMPL